jgi:arylsulfatase A-like enzyme/Tfp pilus assembly protein PilF
MKGLSRRGARSTGFVERVRFAANRGVGPWVQSHNQDMALQDRPARPRQSRAIGRRRWQMRGLVLGLVLIGAGAWWWMRPSSIVSPTGEALGPLPGGVAPSELNVLLVTLDTTRADRLHTYGFAQAATPHLDRLAARGVTFERAIAPAPLTLPAHSTMFTGKSPPAHGVRDNGGFFLREAELTLAERLRAIGYRTAGFVGAYVLDSKWGLAQGFETYADDFDLSRERRLSLAAIDRPANDVTDRALKWLDGVAQSKFFAWVHYYDAHSPYDPPEPFKSRFSNRPYVGEIAFVDSQVGRLLDWLDGRGLASKTVVVVLGDHGESLGEHAESTHAFFVYEGVLHVPFIVRAPYEMMAGRRVGDVVRTVDLLPTVADLLGLEVADDLEGESLAPLMTGTRRELGLAAYSEATYPRFHFGWSDLRALRSGRFKYIAAPRPELYDLESDPREERNLYDERRALGDRMAGELEALERRFEQPDEASTVVVEVDPDARDRLAALGYVGTFVTQTAGADRSGLADPKDKIALFNLMTSAREASKREPESDAAIRALEQVVAEDPDVIDAWFMLGNEHTRRRQHQRAIDMYRRALALKPDYDLAVINMANAYRSLGKDDEALVGYRRFMELDPKNAQIRYEAAQIMLDAGALDEAAEQLQEALRLEPTLAAARNALGVVAFRRGDAALAEREIRAAIEVQSDVRLAHFNLALLAEERGDLRQAMAEYEREIALHPSSFRALFNMSRLHRQVGNRPAEREALQKSIDVNPQFAEGHLFLARHYLETGERLGEAVELAARGLALEPDPLNVSLGHYILADLYNRLGRRDDAADEAARGRAAERRFGAKRRAAGS